MIRDTTGVPRTRHDQPAGAAAQPIPRAAEPQPEQPGIPMLNPRLRLEAGLNLVVLEFRDGGGELQHSIPSPRELEAYRVAAAEEKPLPDSPSVPA